MDDNDFPEGRPETFYPPELSENPESPGELAEGSFSDEEIAVRINASIAFINRTVASVVQAAIAIGEHLLTDYFNNDIELAMSKNPYKNISYKRLCDHPDLMLPRWELGNMLRIAVQERFFRSREFNADALSLTHRRFLTRLPDNDDKTRLAAECVENRYSSRRLYQRIMEIKGLAESEENRGAEHLVATYADRFSRAIRQVELPDIFDDPEAIGNLTPDSRAALRETAFQWVNDLESLQSRCQALIQRLDQGDDPEF